MPKPPSSRKKRPGNPRGAFFFCDAHLDALVLGVGAKSGFDTLAECYEEPTPLFAAVERGLPTDPPENWKCSFPDAFTLLPNSDARLPDKMGRNANLLAIEVSCSAICAAIAEDGTILAF